MIQIHNSKIGPGFPAYIVAELSCNHNQNYEEAIKLIHSAKDAGANAIKLQTYTPDTLTIDCKNNYFKINKNTIWDNQYLYDLYKTAYTPWEWHKSLKEEANNLEMDLFSSPFDTTSVDFLEKLDMPAYKIASFEACDHILLKKVAQTKKPVILSSGTSDLSEIIEAVNILKSNGTTQLCILKCTSEYPAPIEEANLKTIKHMSKTLGLITGLSDHTLGIEVPIAAVCLGANFIEKHFTLSRTSGSPDDKFSLEPLEFKQMVNSIRKVEKAIGTIKYLTSEEKEAKKCFRRSLFVTREIKKGEKISEENIKSIRPGYGLHTKHYEKVLNKTAKEDISRGTPLSWDLIE